MNRCRSHFQGDKCRLSSGHDGRHASPLHIWADGEELVEIKLPSMRQAKKDWRNLLKMGPAIRFKFWPVYKNALKNCDEFLTAAEKARKCGPTRNQPAS